ncbi:MAG TPA: hypothetical protein DDW87_11625, partial [Firmicutes bacterium]|nr:hypothetical protein [Bacillota bacterium]
TLSELIEYIIRFMVQADALETRPQDFFWSWGLFLSASGFCDRTFTKTIHQAPPNKHVLHKKEIVVACRKILGGQMSYNCYRLFRGQKMEVMVCRTDILIT